ncbi:Hsp20/alpha crystallin family protein [Colwelliaceae bacterium 6471]
MSLFKHQPLSTIPQLPIFSQLSDEMNRFFGRDVPMAGRQENLFADEWHPAADIEQKDTCYIVRADIPGVNPKDIKVSLDNNNLIIEGKRETQAEEHKENYRRVERFYGSFYRSFHLPDASDAKKVEAHCKNGVLEVTIPKVSTSKQKKIEVKVD